MMMTMQCTNSTRFSSSGFAGCHNSTPLTMDLALEIRLIVPEGRPAICVFSLRVDPRDTTNKRSLSVIVERTLRNKRSKAEVSQIKPPLASVDGVKLLDPLIRCTRANDKSSRMVISPSRTQTITLHTNRRIMQPTLGVRLKISTSEVRKHRSDADSTSDLA